MVILSFKDSICTTFSNIARTHMRLLIRLPVLSEVRTTERSAINSENGSDGCIQGGNVLSMVVHNIAGLPTSL